MRWLAALCLVVSPALADTPDPFVNNCLSCHGVDGKSAIPFVPIIHGQQEQYLVNALTAYRDNARMGGHAPVMHRIVEGFSDAEISELAAWFSDGASVVQQAALKEITKGTENTSMDLLYLTDDAGWQRLLNAKYHRDYFQVSPWVESEKFLTFCSIASMAAVLNSLPIDRPFDSVRYPYPYFTQDNLFTETNEHIKSFEQVVTDGLVLQQIAEFASTMGAITQPHHADDRTPKDQMRELIRSGLSRHDTRVIVNYDRSVLGQKGGGHVSPLVAYDAASDSFLVLDVARYKYPPVWVSFDMLYKAMNAKDSGSDESRGIVLVEPA